MTDLLLDAFHAACDEDAADIAVELFVLLTEHVKQPCHLPAGIERRKIWSLLNEQKRLRDLLAGSKQHS